jgi:hypothetical protein
MDILKMISRERKDPIYSFLSISWCMIADVDLESEHLRWMGETRFTIWALLRIIKRRQYRAKLAYLGEEIFNKNQEVTPIDGYSDSVIASPKNNSLKEESKYLSMRRINNSELSNSSGNRSCSPNMFDNLHSSWKVVDSKECTIHA